MRILGIETSCDETAAAVVKDGARILSNIIASSAEMHAKTGGVIPEQAARQQLISIIPVIDKAIKESGQNYQYIDALAVTAGPGLIGSLLVGVETAKTLACVWNKPIIPVNHLLAHVYANWLTDRPADDNRQSTPDFPALALVVSGGHTDLVILKGHGQIGWLGGTRDDAAGEAFDKTARLLGLPYPGGPSIAAEAAKFTINNSQFSIHLPRPMINEDNFDFSFSGLKTAVLSRVKEQDRPTRFVESRRAGRAGGKRVKEINTSQFAYEVQEAICDCLVAKTLKAVKKFKPKSLLLAGGVAANSRLREKFQLEIGSSSLEIKFYVPPPKLCTDNAACVASYADFNYSPIPWKNIKANPELTIVGEA